MSLVDEKIIERLPSSFVFKNLKLKGDKGSGEAKLHLGSASLQIEFDEFFNDFDNNDIYKFDKENFLRYMDQVKIEYTYEKINRYYNINLDYWNKKVNEIHSLNSSDFKFKLTKHVDRRYYIRAYEDIFRNLFRKIALPLITNLKIEKYENSDKNNYIYLFLLELNTNYKEEGRTEEKEDKSNDRSRYIVKYKGLSISNSPYFMTEVPYRIVKHYINTNNLNNNLTFGELKEVFKDCRSGNTDIVLDINKINPKRPGDYITLKSREPLELDGTTFGVYNEWRGGPNANFSKFIENVKLLDYTVSLYGQEENKNLVGINKIYFGAPGTGKSRHVDEKYYENKLSKRVTFHPEYSYNDFVGYIRPVDEEDNLTYKFIPGTFTEILAEALNDPNNMYSLIIEELNRANTAAVFGDLFQLLDRDSEGVSEYDINNPEIYKYIKEELREGYNVEDGSIYIPNNLNIIATMNTADQNVFAMDTAFKRRWKFEYIPVEFKIDHHFKDNLISGLNIRWIDFVNTINQFMMSKENSSLMISEDKQIGQYFVKEEELKNTNEFGYKVLLYLWDDVFKMDRESMFKDNIRTFSHLMNTFSNENSLDVFSEYIKEQLKGYVREVEE